MYCINRIIPSEFWKEPKQRTWVEWEECKNSAGHFYMPASHPPISVKLGGIQKIAAYGGNWGTGRVLYDC